MRFFTPSLFRRLNSSRPDGVDKAQQEWELGIQQYRAQLAILRRRMTAPVKALSKLVLHDWDVVTVGPGIGSGQQVISLRRGAETIVLLYQLWERPRVSQPSAGFPFSAEHKHWLYDEVDGKPGSPGQYIHRILFSDGSVMVIPFTDCAIIS
jgi:hypothetical protein